MGLGLNTQVHKLWKDRAMVELNVAVLHSFQVSLHLHHLKMPIAIFNHGPVCQHYCEK